MSVPTLGFVRLDGARFVRCVFVHLPTPRAQGGDGQHSADPSVSRCAAASSRRCLEHWGPPCQAEHQVRYKPSWYKPSPRSAAKAKEVKTPA